MAGLQLRISNLGILIQRLRFSQKIPTLLLERFQARPGVGLTPIHYCADPPGSNPAAFFRPAGAESNRHAPQQHVAQSNGKFILERIQCLCDDVISVGAERGSHFYAAACQFRDWLRRIGARVSCAV